MVMKVQDSRTEAVVVMGDMEMMVIADFMDHQQSVEITSESEI